MYEGQEYNIFISYRGNSEGGLLGSKIYSDLLHYANNNKEKEFSPFFAPACIPKGVDFKKVISDVFEDVKCVVMILDVNYFNKCTEEDDMVFFELITALQNPQIKFIPIVFPGFQFNDQKTMLSLFDTNDIDRFRHVNPIRYHGVYDFKTEIDLVPVMLSALKASSEVKPVANTVTLDITKFTKGKGKKMTFGRYPQTVLSDLPLIEKITSGMFSGETILNANSNTLNYNGTEYASIAENPFNKTKFDNGKVINAGARNYYVVDNLNWIVLYENADYAYLISEKIIDAIQYNLNRVHHKTPDGKIVSPNDWELSYIRRWLNNEFYYDAFTDEEREKIQTVCIPNDANEHYYKEGGKATIDSIFLTSHREIMPTAYGSASTTDYARARGAYSSTSASHLGKGDWWTRSPGVTKDSIENIDRRGCVDAVPFCNYVDDTAASVRPCLIIKK